MAMVDTVRLYGPVTSTDALDTLAPKRQAWTQTDVRTGEWDEQPQWSLNGVRLSVHRRQGTTYLAFETSLPRHRTGSNLRLLPLPEATDAVHALYNWLNPYVGWRVDVADLHVARLDASLDFTGTTQLHRILPALAALPVPHERQSPSVWYDPARGGAQTLTRGTQNTDRATLYDKHAEVLHRAAKRWGRPHARAAEAQASQGVARFEVQARRAFLSKHGIATWKDVTEERVATMRRQSFEHRRFGTSVAGGQQFLQALAQADLSEARRASLLWEVTSRAMGRTPEFDQKTVKRNREDMTRLGLTFDDLLLSAPQVRLDYETHRQVSTADLN